MKPSSSQQPTMSRSSFIFFILGLSAIIGVITVTALALTSPNFATRLDSLSYRARGYYRSLFPPPPFLPTPAAQAAVSLPPTPTRTPTLTPTPTPPPTASTTPQPTATPTLTPSPTVTPPPQTTLTVLTHEWQTWNNCGPATIAMYLNYFKPGHNQATAAQFLKPNRDDKNVSPTELAAYAENQGLQALVQYGGTLPQLKQFVSQGLPVLVETWFSHDGDEMGHYRLVTGYDDTSEQVTLFDSYNGPHIKLSYTDFITNWRVFNGVYVLVYPADQADRVTALIGTDMNPDEHLLAQAQAEIEANPNDPIAFFNQGDALTRLGQFEAATLAFDQARRLKLHWRRLWYQTTPFEAYYQAGRYQDVIDLSQATLKNSGGLEEAYYYLGLALEKTGQPGAAENFQAALDYNPHFTLAQEALIRLQGGN